MEYDAIFQHMCIMYHYYVRIIRLSVILNNKFALVDPQMPELNTHNVIFFILFGSQTVIQVSCLMSD